MNGIKYPVQPQRAGNIVPALSPVNTAPQLFKNVAIRMARRRWLEEGIPKLFGYLAIVRHAIPTPFLPNISTSSSSERTALASSFPIKSLSWSRTHSDECLSPPSDAGSADEKKNFSTNIPRGVSIYLLETTRLAALSWIPTMSAIAPWVSLIRPLSSSLNNSLTPSIYEKSNIGFCGNSCS